MDNKKINELRGKILKGIELSFEELVRQMNTKNDELVFSKDGKIFFVKANELIKQLKKK